VKIVSVCNFSKADIISALQEYVATNVLSIVDSISVETVTIDKGESMKTEPRNK
jgi:hypothetical protein